MASSVTSLVALLTVWSVCITVWVVMLSVHNMDLKKCKRNKQTTSTIITSPWHSPGASTPHSTQAASLNVENRLLHYHSQIFHWSDDSLEKCTLVLLILQEKAVIPLLKHYCGITILKRILLVWNNLDAAVPLAFKQWVKICKSGLKLIQPHTPKLTNRYLPWQEIETDCVYLADEGHYPTTYCFLTTYEAWQSSRHLLVGYQESSYLRLPNSSFIYTPHEKRLHIGAMEDMDNEQGRTIDPKLRIGQALNLSDRVSEEFKPNGYSIMSTPCFIHRAYLEMFFDPLMVPASAVQYVEKQRDCEDILLSIMVTKFWQDSNTTPNSGVLATKGPSAVKGPKPPPPHYHSQRSQCLNRFSQIYGYLPLQISNIMAITN